MGRLLRDSDLVPGVVAVASLLGTTLGLELPVLAGLGIGAAVYAGVRFLMPDADPEVAPGVRRSRLEAGVADLSRHVAAVADLGGRVRDPEVRQRVDTIVATGQRIVTHVGEDPADLLVAQPLLTLYLESTTGILRNFVRLESRDVASARASLAKAEDEAVPLLEAKVTELYEHLQRDEVVALTVDSELVEFRTRGITGEGL